jgi:hypothetical protein
MRRFVIAGLIALAAVSATVATAATADGPSARLRGFVCQTALDPASRGMSITAVMRPLPATMKLAMRFELLKRTKRWGRSVSLSGSGLKTWITPKDPTLGREPGDKWVVKHPVVDLAAPAYYRFKVTFRWTGANGHVIGKTVRESPLCFQPELRADVEVTGIQVVPVLGNPGLDRYLGTIRNAGRTASGPFRVEFTDGPDGPWSPQFKSISQLLPHHQTMVSFKGPVCSAAAPATITADPDHQVDDANPSNNSMQTTCS